MHTSNLFRQLHQLVEDFHERRLSTADYRLRRRRILLALEENMNGGSDTDDRAGELITLRKTNQ